MVEGDAEEFIFTKNGDGPLTVYYQLDPSTTVSSADYEINPAFGSVFFAAGEHSKTVSIEAIRDGIFEHLETLDISITPYPSGGQGPVPYIVVGQGSATLEFHDGDVGIVETDYTTDWLDVDGNWASSPQGETLWDDETIRWLPDLPEEIIDDITSIQWLKRPHDSPQSAWTGFASGNVENPAVGNPGDGYWDVTYRVSYGIMSYYQAVTKDKFVAGIAGVSWQKGYDDQQFLYMVGESGGPRVFPEYNSPSPSEFELEHFNEVKLVITLKQVVPLGFVARVDAKVFDPDHAHTPEHANDTHDPNDVFVLGPLTPTPVPDDNRQTSGTELEADGTYGFGARVGATLEQTSLTIQAGNSQKTVIMTIEDRRHLSGKFLFDAPGIYRIRAVATMPWGDLPSEPVAITVKERAADDLKKIEAIRPGDLWVLALPSLDRPLPEKLLDLKPVGGNIARTIDNWLMAQAACEGGEWKGTRVSKEKNCEWLREHIDPVGYEHALELLGSHYRSKKHWAGLERVTATMEYDSIHRRGFSRQLEFLLKPRTPAMP